MCSDIHLDGMEVIPILYVIHVKFLASLVLVVRSHVLECQPIPPPLFKF